MKISNRRIALLTGASVAVMGYAAPAFAATAIQPGVCQSNSGADVSETLDITLVGNTGVASDSHPANAVVNSCPTGEIVQSANATGAAPDHGDVDATIKNGAAGEPGVLAIAMDTNTTGNATAFASIFNYGVGQLGGGAGTIDLAIDNDGSLLTDADAIAKGTGLAVATATMGGSNGLDWGYGIYQSATGVNHGGASAINVAIANDGAITVDASGYASGATATANAHGDWGIWQIGSGGETVAVDLTNNGTIAVNAAAMANAGEGDASADADLVGGIVQAAFSGTSLAANIDNGGLIQVAVGAFADAAATALADAHLTYGVAQTVGATMSGTAGSGIASINNDSRILVHLGANATGGDLAMAHAAVSGTSAGGVIQVVNALAGDTGSAAIENAGTIDVSATANASAYGTALASASIANGIVQNVTGMNGGDATAYMTNAADGVIDINAAAIANGVCAKGRVARSDGDVAAADYKTIPRPGA
jgi:hypothetical protein